MKCRRLKIFLTPLQSIITVLSVTSVYSAAEISREDWSITLGLGIFYESGYEGSGRWSVSVSGNWRLTFEFNNGNVELLNYEDFH